MNNRAIIVVFAVLMLAAGAFYLYKSQSAYKQTGVPASNQVTQPPTFQNSATRTPTQSATTDESVKEVTVNITASGFQPATITIKAGTKVTWVNKSGQAVSIYSALHPTHLVYPSLNLGVVEDGNSASLVFDTIGTFKYHDHFNPSDSGTIIVE